MPVPINNPFVSTTKPPLPSGKGMLEGKRLAVKDVFDVENTVTGFGNPTWAARQRPATNTATVVQQLITAGAQWAGKTITDEFAYSLEGQNIHYGIPLNPVAPERLPGGSSSGSASAVAQRLADIGLGTDTGGSIRVPASYMGLFGFRPTHGALDTDGLQPLAPSFDTVGLLTRDPVTLHRCLIACGLTPMAAFQNGPLGTINALFEQAEHGPQLLRLFDQLASKPEPRDSLSQRQLDEAANAFVTLQGAEIWQRLGPWLKAHQPIVSPAIKARLDHCASLTDADIEAATQVRHQIIQWSQQALSDNGILVLPTTPGPAPLINMSDTQRAAYRTTLLSFTCLAGLAGLPQLHVPQGQLHGAPVGFSLIGPPGSDLNLVERAITLLGHLEPTHAQ
ncbi:amidase [Aestuariibacter halophilus]|uniref:Amidase n=1 Tax=Fluctibacter halophilus TaxID=226011 RepID=A0ABS8G940_9ALTE|nr:amidase [Aestuariibacter halophilus]MCC2615721.1 amidase [Aestuariibacter halophilus]